MAASRKVKYDNESRNFSRDVAWDITIIRDTTLQVSECN